MSGMLKMLVGLLFVLAVAVPPADASFGLKDLGMDLENQDSTPVTEAGTHPFAVTTTLSINIENDPELGVVPEGAVKDIAIHFPPGLVGNPTAVEPCSN